MRKECSFCTSIGLVGLLYCPQVRRKHLCKVSWEKSYLDMLESNQDINPCETLEQFISSRAYSELFRTAYLIPACCSIWSCTLEQAMSFSASSVLSVFRNHSLLQLYGSSQRFSIRNSKSYVHKVRERLESWGCQIRIRCEIYSVSSTEEGCNLVCGDGSQEQYSACIMAVDAPEALRLLGSQVTFDEMRVLGDFHYIYRDVFLHHDEDFMPQNPTAWSACNFVESIGSNNIGETSLPFLITLNPDQTPKHTLLKWSIGHPVPSVAASKASFELDHIQGKRGIWFCGAYQGYGFNEDGVKWGLMAANGLLGKSCAILSNPRHMVPSLMETGARLFVARFLGHYINTGHLIFWEEGGTIFNFEGKKKNCHLKSILRIHNPAFYWKVMTETDLGLTDSYINGDFSFVDKNEGL